MARSGSYASLLHILISLTLHKTRIHAYMSHLSIIGSTSRTSPPSDIQEVPHGDRWGYNGKAEKSNLSTDAVLVFVGHASAQFDKETERS